MGMEVGGKKGGPMASMNIVPLIDILLVLLIIFMVITPLTPHGIDTLVPQPPPKDQAKQPEVDPNKVIVVQVLENGKLKINDEDTTWQTMGPRLSDVFKTRAEKIAFIKGDDSVRFADVARAMDIMRASGIDSIGLITAKMESQSGG